MEPLGKVVRDFLTMRHAKDVRQAYAMADSLQKEGMSTGQIEEMLFSSGFQAGVIDEAIRQLPAGGRRRK